jgi:hypothetical protein
LKKDDKPKTELELKEIEEDNTGEEFKNLQNKKINNNSNNKNPPLKSPSFKQQVKFKSESSKGVVDLSNSAKKPREFNLSTSVKKKEINSTNSSGKVKKNK